MNTFFQIVLSNVLFATLLAGVALCVERLFKRPLLAYILWVAVFVKLVCPPVITFSAPEISFLNSTADPQVVDVSSSSPATTSLTLVPQGTTSVQSDVEAQSTPVLLGVKGDQIKDNKNRITSILSYGWHTIQIPFICLWIAVSIGFLICTLVRGFRFNRLINIESEPPSYKICALAEEIAGQLGLQKMPSLRIIRAQVSPFVWWMGGRVYVIMPQCLINGLTDEELRCVLCHELAHVRRRDYWVRWLEWGTGVCFWWNPVVRWGSRHLRANEEICCDDLALAKSKENPYHYASSLLRAVEQLASCSAKMKVPNMASGMNSDGALEKRLRMIVSGTNRSTMRYQRVCLSLLVIGVLPLACLAGKTKILNSELSDNGLPSTDFYVENESGLQLFDESQEDESLPIQLPEFSFQITSAILPEKAQTPSVDISLDKVKDKTQLPKEVWLQYLKQQVNMRKQFVPQNQFDFREAEQIMAQLKEEARVIELHSQQMGASVLKMYEETLSQYMKQQEKALKQTFPQDQLNPKEVEQKIARLYFGQ